MSQEKIKFEEKRGRLELFVKEQIIGPGAFNKRFFLLDKWSENEFNGKKLEACKAIENQTELISEVPAYQYSSAILFPEARISDEDIKNEPKEEENDGDVNDFSENENASEKVDDDELAKAIDNSESVTSKNQNYPNTCGIAFAINGGTNLENELKISVSFRAYQRKSQSECKEERLGYWVQENAGEIGQIINDYFYHVFEVETKDENLFVCIKKEVDINEYLYSLDYLDLERLLKDKVLDKIEEAFPDKQFFKRAKRTYNSEEYEFTILYEDTLNDEIVKELKNDPNSFGRYSELIRWLEIFNQVKEIVTQLKTIYKKSTRKNKPTPIWESFYIECELHLDPFERNDKMIKRGELKVEGSNKLFLNYQYLRYDNDNIYVKLILVNKNILYLKPNESQQLNKKDEANRLSFFGVQLKVRETRANVLQPYNPPNLLEIDEEDNFNKLLYRQYKDYGEGYNTSVNWGVQKENEKLRFVVTDFLPEQETPKVDYRPSKNVNGNIVSRINDDVLSMRALSTLTERKDEEAKAEILNKLDEFIDNYQKWIEEKEKELLLIKDVSQRKDLLERQLKACKKDYDRLKRNITLLKKDDRAMAAFRVMNTAMFMQLHHSIQVKEYKKENKAPYLPEKNEEEYYKKLELQKDYKWRAFQLGFILLNIDAFVRPNGNDKTVIDVFGTGWPERNELADLIWFPAGGGKTEAYLGIIAFAIAYRRFTKGERGYGTTTLMRYTLRLLTLQQFQRATLLICALEVLRKDSYSIPHNCDLGSERITIGLFVGSGSLPNTWGQMNEELEKIKKQLTNDNKSGKVKTNLPHSDCPWCGSELFVDKDLRNIHPSGGGYNINDSLKIMCNSKGCTFNSRIPNGDKSLPLRLFDEDIYKYPPTLLFGTVDKFAALANKVSTQASQRNQDSRRLLGRGYNHNVLPPELIIQDELHLLLGPLGSAVGLFEKAIDELCTYTNEESIRVKPKIITSTATTRNTDKQIFAIFNRRSETFPKQGIDCDDSFFAYYERKGGSGNEYTSNRKYIGILPIGKTQVWMQLRLASISLAHRLKFIKEKLDKKDIFSNSEKYNELKDVIDYYHTILSYFNSLKEVGKTQSQLSHYLPGDVNLVVKNTLPWDFLDKLIRTNEIRYSELTGRLSGEEVKTNLNSIEGGWELLKEQNPPEFVISTNMISVGIDVSRFNTMIISSMPRNTAEYIQASSRVARDKEGIVFTVHHPFRSRDISHYQRFKEFHEKFYAYVEPISVTPFAYKSLERYLAMYLAAIVRHNEFLNLEDNDDANNIDDEKFNKIKEITTQQIRQIKLNSSKLNDYLKEREDGIRLDIEGIIGDEEYNDVEKKIAELVKDRWLERLGNQEPHVDLKYRDDRSDTSLFDPKGGLSLNHNWNVKQSLREIAPSAVVKTVQQ